MIWLEQIESLVAIEKQIKLERHPVKFNYHKLIKNLNSTKSTLIDH
jgi:hypothetical protein